jgi:hypothetical protein
MKTNQSNKHVKTSGAKNKIESFIAGEPGLARTLGKVSLVLSIFGVIAPFIPPHIFVLVLPAPLVMSIIIGSIGFVLSKKEGKSNLYAVVGTIASLGYISFYLLMAYGLSKL